MSEFKPGCFGSPLCCRPNQEVCRSCEYFETCEPAAQLLARKFRQDFAPHLFTRKLKEPKVDKFETRLIKVMDMLEERSICLKDIILNPKMLFTSKLPDFLRIASFNLLVGKLARDTLKDQLMNELKFSVGNAELSANLAIGVLQKTGAAVIVDSQLIAFTKVKHACNAE